MPRGVPQYTESAALTFGAVNTDNVNCGSAAVLDNVDIPTMIAWVYPTSIALQMGIMSKGSVASFQKAMGARLTTGQVGCILRRATTDASPRSANSAGNVLTVNTW